MGSAFHARLRSLGFTSYAAYLRSDLWAAKKAAYRESRLPQKCLACGNPDFQLHHRTYARLGDELLFDLLPLCGACHAKVHEYEKTHGTRIEATNKILRKVFRWTKSQTAKRFRPFKLPGSKRGFRWVPKNDREMAIAMGEKPPKKEKRQQQPTAQVQPRPRPVPQPPVVSEVQSKHLRLYAEMETIRVLYDQGLQVEVIAVRYEVEPDIMGNFIRVNLIPFR